MLKHQRFVFNPFYENTYLIWDQSSKHAAIVDPGCYDEKERRIVDDFIQENSLVLISIINTHCHIDHIFGNEYFKGKYNSQLMVPVEDEFLLDEMIVAAKEYQVNLVPSPKPDYLIKANDELRLGESLGKFLLTPGHSPGEVCLYFEKEKICFTGDVLFKESIGRTDLWGGNFATLIKSITNELFSLPEDITIYPGHESASTIAHEKKHNPFLQ